MTTCTFTPWSTGRRLWGRRRKCIPKCNTSKRCCLQGVHLISNLRFSVCTHNTKNYDTVIVSLQWVAFFFLINSVCRTLWNVSQKQSHQLYSDGSRSIQLYKMYMHVEVWWQKFIDYGFGNVFILYGHTVAVCLFFHEALNLIFLCFCYICGYKMTLLNTF
jgi:hypothetical protein